MKKIYFSILGMAVGLGLNAQVAVTFSVDMTGQAVSPNGVHLAGAFNDPDQDGTLFPANYNAAYANWTPSAIELIDADLDMVYSVTLNLNPARYEFKFINDNNWGPGEEAVPPTCQVGGGNGNREVYVADFASAYTICWNSCAPCGQKAVRFRVDMSTQTALNPVGVHVAGAFQNPIWQAGASPLRDRDQNGVWEGFYVVNGGSTFEYKFINDNTFDNGLAEIVSGICSAGNENRTITLTDDNTVLPVVCFNSCSPCVEPSMITFRVNLVNSCINTSEGVNLMGTATNWGTGTPMTDDNLDGIWELTLPVSPGTYAYKFRVGEGNWEGFPGDRALTVVGGEDAILDLVCWGLAVPCGPFNAPADITFKVYPGISGVPAGQYAWVFGDFTGFQGGALQMTDADADGIYEVTVADFCPQVLNYKFAIGADNTNTTTDWLEETADFTEIGGCGVNNGNFSDNRFYERTNTEPVVLSYTFNTCLAATISVEENQMISSLNVYPVPATDMINVSFNSSVAQTINVRILNNLGQVVVNQPIGTVSGTRLVTMDVAQLASGLYTLELVGNAGKTSKLVAIK